MKFISLAIVLAASVFAGCVSRTDAAPLVRVQNAPAAMAGCAPAARAVAPGYSLAVADPTGVVSEVGPLEHARAALAIPGSVVECTGKAVGEAIGVGGRWLRCVGGAILPTPTPSVRYTYGYGSPAANASPCCGRACGVPTSPNAPTPIPLPVDPANPNDPPESIPAFRR